ncbi:hypothetical protein pb186bvf_013174 [Paramecium bursaria]
MDFIFVSSPIDQKQKCLIHWHLKTKFLFIIKYFLMKFDLMIILQRILFYLD